MIDLSVWPMWHGGISDPICGNSGIQLEKIVPYNLQKVNAAKNTEYKIEIIKDSGTTGYYFKLYIKKPGQGWVDMDVLGDTSKCFLAPDETFIILQKIWSLDSGSFIKNWSGIPEPGQEIYFTITADMQPVGVIADIYGSSYRYNARFHTGVDIAVVAGSAVYTMQKGKVHLFANRDNMCVESNELRYQYGHIHLSPVLPEAGKDIEAHTFVGTISETIKFNHLHYSILQGEKPIANPLRHGLALRDPQCEKKVRAVDRIYFKIDDNDGNGEIIEKNNLWYVRGKVDIVCAGEDPVEITCGSYKAGAGVGAAEYIISRMPNKDRILHKWMFKHDTFKTELPDKSSYDTFFSLTDPATIDYKINYYILTNNEDKNGGIEGISKKGCWDTTLLKDGRYEVSVRFWSGINVKECSDWITEEVIVDNTSPEIIDFDIIKDWKSNDLCSHVGKTISLEIEWDQPMNSGLNPVVEIETRIDTWTKLKPEKGEWHTSSYGIENAKWKGVFVLPEVKDQQLFKPTIRVSKARGIGIFSHDNMSNDMMKPYDSYFSSPTLILKKSNESWIALSKDKYVPQEHIVIRYNRNKVVSDGKFLVAFCDKGCAPDITEGFTWASNLCGNINWVADEPPGQYEVRLLQMLKIEGKTVYKILASSSLEIGW